jgi:hypothetical protein
MKIIFGILVLFIFILLLLFITPRYLAFSGRKEVPEMTQEKAQKLFDSVGGVDAVNREARILFDRFATNNWWFLDSKDLKNTPAISSLYSICENYSGKTYSGTSMAFDPQSGRSIEIKFGNHWSLKWIYIFDTNAV